MLIANTIIYMMKIVYKKSVFAQLCGNIWVRVDDGFLLPYKSEVVKSFQMKCFFDYSVQAILQT